MGVRAQLRDRVAALLGVSAYQPQKQGYGPELDDRIVEEIREALGGQLQPVPTTKLRWYLADLERAQSQADAGDLMMAAQLHRAMRRDGVLAGLLGTRAGGLVRLPKRFYGDATIAEDLRAKNGSRSVFDEMFPPSELTQLASDGTSIGIGVAELVPVEGRDYPVMIRLDPEYLRYRWTENRWYFSSVAGLLPITPGDGRWILHTPGARMSPWNAGLWPALGRSFINKEHAMLHRSNYSAKLANPARAAFAPPGASEPQRKNFIQKLIAWGVNTVFEMPPGWDVKIIESNGVGNEVFQKEIDTSDLEFMVAIAGQLVTTTGGTGFANADIHRRIREDLIKSDGDALAYTINTQGIPQYIVAKYGDAALDSRWTSVEWDTSTPKELEAEARTLLSVAQAIGQLAEVLRGVDRRLNIDELATRFAIPLAPAANDADQGAADRPQPELAATVSEPATAKAIASLVARLPAAARRMPIDELVALQRRAA
jgi:hypothetical protein